MINKQELVFVVDENNNPLEPQPRYIAHAKGLWHRTSGIWVLNSKKQLLCQKRSLKKDVKPGFWEAFFGGHVAADEDYQHNAAYEAGEELGISVDEGDLISYKVLPSNKPTHREFQGIFALKLDKDVDAFHIEEDEVDELRWIGIEEVKDILLIKNDPKWVHKPWDGEVLNWLPTL